MANRSNKSRSTSRKSSNPRRRRRRLKETYGTSFERLEQRNLLATVTVSTAADVVDSFGTTITDLINSPGADGEISLREAILAANFTPGADTILFDAATFNGESADVIRLQSPLTISGSISIDGGDLGVVVSGDRLGNDILLADSFISDVQANEAAGTIDDNSDGVFVLNSFSSQEVTISGLAITGGNSSNGGGIQIVDAFSGTISASISRSTIAGNRATSSGGGIHSNSSDLFIDQSSIRDNFANRPNYFFGGEGGGIATLNGTLTVSNSTISDNVARGDQGAGGGIHSDNTEIFLSSSTISGNAATGLSGLTRGGGIYSERDSVFIDSSTITNNSAYAGGGIAIENIIFGSDTLSLNNSIIAGNSVISWGDDLVTDPSLLLDINFSLIGDSTGTGLVPSPFVSDDNGNLIGDASNPIDPQLGELTDNGGPTRTHALLPSSPALDAGSSDLPYDQRGLLRFSGVAPDMGAYEQSGLTFVVDSSANIFNGNFAPGDLTLPEAISLANSTPGNDTITFDADVFDGEEQDVIYLQNTLDIFESVTIDAGGAEVVVSGDVLQNDALLPGFISDVTNFFNRPFDNVRVFNTFVSQDSEVTFRGLTITGGQTGIGDGGGIQGQGTIIVEDSVIAGNSADESGGGIHIDFGNLKIINSSISNNRSGTFSDRENNGGGGVSSFTADVEIVGSSISHNTNVNDGGGIRSFGGDIFVTNSTISNNTSRSEGGGVFTDAGALHVTSSTISGNRSEAGGSGIHGLDFALTITDSTITQNETGELILSGNPRGGVLVTSNSFSTPSLVTITNSIIAGNISASSTPVDLIGNFNTSFDISSSLIGSNTGNDLTPTPIGFTGQFGNIIGSALAPVDPLLADLADNGGPTLTHALLPTSPAIDAGNAVSTSDQRGQSRPFDQLDIENSFGSDGSDIGAFEFQGLILTVDSSIDENNGDFSVGNRSLREAIDIANTTPGNDWILFDANVFDGEIQDVIRLHMGELQITEGVRIDAVNTNVVVSADTLGNDIVDPITFITDVDASVSAGVLSDNSGRVFNVMTSLGENVAFQGLTITGGNTATGGGGINADSATLELFNATVSGNRASGSGGGVLFNEVATFTNSTISGNVAADGGGGGGIAINKQGLLSLIGSTVSGNRATGEGGGIHTPDFSALFIEDSIITQNTISGDGSGGGIYALGEVQITDSVISENQSGFFGGGVFAGGGPYGPDSLTIEGSTVADNEALYAGGGIYFASVEFTFSNSILSNNATTGTGAAPAGIDSGGGGIFSLLSSLSVSGSTVIGNSTAVDEARGGAIAAITGRLRITSTTFGDNRTFGDHAEGGAVATVSADVRTTTSTFSGNSTQGTGSGGGAIATESGDIQSTSSTFSSNSTSGANASGGALATSTGDVTLSSTTITQNRVHAISSYGGGVFISNDVSHSPTFESNSSIIARNHGRIARDLFLDLSTTLDFSFSLIGDGTGSFLASSAVPDSNGNLIGSFTAVIDPMLDVLSNNGGLTQTHAPLPGSPTIDAGNATFTNDQRGRPFVRTSGNAPDIGSVESQTFNLIVDDDSDIVDGIFSTNRLSLREAIELANANPGEDFITFSPNQFRGSIFDTIHLTQGELTITESVTIDGQELGVVISGDSAEDDGNFAGTSITNLSQSLDSQLDDNSRVFNITAAAGEVITLNGLIITGGVAGSGAGIRNEAADLAINQTTIAGNLATGNGGGIFNDAGSLTISASTINDNQTRGTDSSGGGIYTNTGAIEISNSTISGNDTIGLAAGGGGIATTSGDVTLDSVTVTNNDAGGGSGGGIFVSDSAANATLTIQNTIVAGNSIEGSASSDLQFNSIPELDIRFSLIGDNSGTPLIAAPVSTPDADGNVIGSSTATIDPLLEALANNGGLTLTHEPLANSPVLNAGGSSTLITDQRNIPLLARDDGQGVDIGALERTEFLLVVDTSSDIDDGDLSAGNLSLREALVITNTNPGRDTIVFDANVFNGDAADVIRLQSGPLIINDGDTIDAGLNEVVISGDANGDDILVPGSFITDLTSSDAIGALDDNSAGVFNITADAGEEVSIAGVTITGGSKTTFFDDGGGIRNNDASLILSDTTISGNQAANRGDGGGIYNNGGRITLINSVVSDNFADSDGGGIDTNRGEIILNDSSIERNFSTDDGGGIHASSSGSITANNSSISDNQTGRSGGGISTFGSIVTLNNSIVSSNTNGEFGDGGGIDSVSGRVIVNSSTITGNQSGGGGGGGIATTSGDVTFYDSILSDNTSGFRGGGVRTNSGDLTFNRSTINGNQSDDNGGGIETSFGDILLINSTVSGNVSGALGGGIHQAFQGTINLANSTVFENQSAAGVGGIYFGATSSFSDLIIENSIVAGQVAADGTGSDLSFSSTITFDVRNSLIGSNANTPLQPTTAGLPDIMGNLIGTSAAPIDPLLGDLADNGGPTLTHALLPGSPAINAGGAVTVDIGNTDQRGEARIKDGQIDIGAFEFGVNFLLGDVNRDGFVTFLDIDPFINVLSSNVFQAEADVNLDGVINFLDINPFITLLSTQTVIENTANFSAALTQPANLFDAQPELLDEIHDFDLDDVIEGLQV